MSDSKHDAGTGGRGAEPLSPQDATLLCATTTEAQLQIGAVCLVEGGPLRDAAGRLRIDDLRSLVESRLHLAPVMRRRLERTPLDLARAVWVDDTGFDVAAHVRAATLPAPGGVAELREVLRDLLGHPLDPGRPLWDLWLVDGLDSGDVALVLRAHHALADGLSLFRIALALLDFEPHPPAAAPPPAWEPAATPGAGALLFDGLVQRGRNQVGILAGAAVAALDPRRVVGLARSGVNALLSRPQPAPSLPLTARVGARRDFVWGSLPLDELRATARAQGATLNDVVLTVVTGALRRVLGPEASAALAGRPPKVLVPMGGGDGDADGGNAFSFVVTDLPVHLDDTAALAVIHEDMQRRKASRQSANASSLFSVIDVVPLPLLSRLAPEALARQPFVNLAVTNIPGADFPLYLLGARLLEMHPIVTGVGNLACIVGVLSYLDTLGLGITVDPDVIADPGALLDATLESARDLIDALGP